jgi:hypothetical protein
MNLVAPKAGAKQELFNKPASDFEIVKEVGLKSTMT